MVLIAAVGGYTQWWQMCEPNIHILLRIVTTTVVTHWQTIFNLPPKLVNVNCQGSNNMPAIYSVHLHLRYYMLRILRLINGMNVVYSL